MTAVEWLVEKLMKGEFINSTNELIEEAKQMEVEQIKSEKPIIPELSDDEIYEIAYNKLHPLIRKYTIDTFIDGMKAYREQLKQKP